MTIRRTSDKVVYGLVAWLIAEHFFEHYGCKTATEFFEMMSGLFFGVKK